MNKQRETVVDLEKRIGKKTIAAFEEIEDFEDRIHRKTRDKIRACYDKTGSFHEVYTTEVYSDSEYPAEAFIDLVEEKTGEKVRDAEHLKTLAGLTEETDTLEGLQNTVFNARQSRYSRELDRILGSGGKYKDLVAVDPERFGLAEADKQALIKRELWAFALVDSHSINGPILRDVAEKLEAPFRVIMEAVI